jgi:hypothetical protein
MFQKHEVTLHDAPGGLCHGDDERLLLEAAPSALSIELWRCYPRRAAVGRVGLMPQPPVYPGLPTAASDRQKDRHESLAES